MERRDGPGKSDRVVTMNPQQEDVNKLSQRLSLESSEFKKSSWFPWLWTNLEVMEGVKGVVVNKDEVMEGKEEMCRRAGGTRVSG